MAITIGDQQLQLADDYAAALDRLGDRATAVGRLLRPLHGEPRRHRVIAIRPDRSIRTLLDRTLSHGQETDQATGEGRQGDG